MRLATGFFALLVLAPASLRAQSFCEAVTADTLVNPAVLGNGTPGSVTTAQIQAALSAGGHIRFDVGPNPTTITLTATLNVNRAVVLDGGGLVTLSGGGARRIVEITNTQNQTYAITLQNIGFVSASVPAGRGGAIFKQSGGPWQAVSLKLVNCAFTGNAAMPTGQDDGGGALYATGMDHVRIGNSTFTNNTGSNGGAVYSLGTRRVTIVDSVFTGNSATGTGANPGNGGNAGALGIDGADRQVDVCRTRFVGNTSNAHGAGFFSVMYDATSRSRFEDVTFEANRQLSTTEHTGGAYVQDGPFAFERVSFLRNEAQGYGGLFITGALASGTIRNSTFVGNVARTGLGAAMSIGSTSPVSIVNTTIANNVSTAAFAAGISVGATNQLRLTNVILANNTGGNRFVNWNVQNAASQDGGGNMQWPSSRPQNGGAETRATPTSTFADPLLAAAVADNGGSVATIALSSGSPARDSGVTTSEVPSTDARRVARVGAPDRGSFELDLAGGDGDPIITSFQASPVLLNAPGGASTLSWTVVPGATATLETSAADRAAVTTPSGTRNVTAATSTTYTLRATRGSVTESRAVTLQVNDGTSGAGVPTVTNPSSGATLGVAGVTFSWSAVAGASGYGVRVWRSATGETVFSGAVSGGASTSTLVSLPDGAYRFAVRACGADFTAPACGRYGMIDFGVSLIAPATAPAISAPAAGASLNSSTQTLTWTAVARNPALPTMTYEVVVTRLTDDTTELQINVPDPGTSTIFSFRTGSYRMKVRACQAGCGAFSSPVDFSVVLGAVPGTAPTLGSPSVTGNDLTVSWNAVAGADLYQVQIVQPAPAGPGGGALTVAARQVSATSVTLSVPPGTASVVVAACNGDGCGPFSSPSSINPTASTLTTANLGQPMAGTVVNGPTALFTWNRIAGDTGTNTRYRLFIQDLSRQSAALDIFTTNNFYAAFFKAEGAAYGAQVIANPGLSTATTGPATAFNVRGTSSEAPTIVFPANADLSVKTGNVQVGWSPVPGATLYDYFVAVTGQSAASARGVTTGLLVQVPLAAGGAAGTSYTAIARACPAGKACSPDSDADWGPWSSDAGPGGNTFTVVP